MTIKHTPGPWTLEVLTSSAYRLRYVVANDGDVPRVVAEIRDNPDIYVGMKNAHLIAAAPDLLSALYHAETILAKLPDITTNWNGQRPTMSTRRALELVRAALKEASKED